MGRFILTAGGFNFPGGSSQQKQLPIQGEIYTYRWDLSLQGGFNLTRGISFLQDGFYPYKGGDLSLQDGVATLQGWLSLQGGT